MPADATRPSRYAVEPPTFHYRKPVRGSVVWWLRCLGVVALVVVLLRLPGATGQVTLTKIDLRWLGLCMLLTLGQLLLEAFVWQWLMSMQRIPYAFPKTLVAYLASQYLGLVTPGHAGEFLAAGYISTDTGLTFGYALSSVVVKKILYWVSLVGFGVWGLQLAVHVPRVWAVWVGIGTGVCLAIGITVWVFSLRRLARKWQNLSPWQIDPAEFWAGMKQLASPGLIVPLAIAAFAFSLLFFQLDAVLHALGKPLPLVLAAKIMAFSRIISRLVPISVVGFGSKDAAVIGLLAQHGIDPAAGLLVTLLFLLCTYLVTLLLSGVCWWVKPLVVRRIARPAP